MAKNSFDGVVLFWNLTIVKIDLITKTKKDMKKSRIKLADLKVSSFITAPDQLKGGNAIQSVQVCFVETNDIICEQPTLYFTCQGFICEQSQSELLTGGCDKTAPCFC